MQLTRLNGLTIHYRLAAGTAAGPAIVFVNSLGTDFRIWDEVAARLAGDFTMLAYDKRGHGLSDAGNPPYAIPDLAADLAGLMDALDVRDAVICGISVGGLIAQALYAARPDLVRALVLCDTGVKIGSEDAWNDRIAAVADGGVAAVADAILERWFTARFRAEAPAFPVYRNMLVRSDPEAYAGVCVAIREADYADRATAIACPVLCIVGEHDGATPPEVVRHMADLIPGARFLQIADAGHLPCIEQADVFSDALASFVRETTAGNGQDG